MLMINAGHDADVDVGLDDAATDDDDADAAHEADDASSRRFCWVALTHKGVGCTRMIAVRCVRFWPTSFRR